MRHTTSILLLLGFVFAGTVFLFVKASPKKIHATQAATYASTMDTVETVPTANVITKDTVGVIPEDTVGNTGGSFDATVDAAEFVAYAKTLVGTPYAYASVDPARGFDCSGFVNHVSNHFGVSVPRSSVDFTDFGTTINKDNSRPGDLILFTGTDSTKDIVGHIGIVAENNNGDIQFIHSSSGKAKGVTISDLEGYYQSRFVKVIRILS